jgi:hypothetical protein
MLTSVAQLIAQINPIGNPALAPNFQTMTNGYDYLNTILPTIITIAFIIGAVIFIFIFIAGAFGWVTAGGDKGKLEDARRKITHAIVGLVIMLLVWFMIQMVNLILGINIGMIGFPTNPPGFEPGSCDNLCNCTCPPGKPYPIEPCEDPGGACPTNPSCLCSDDQNQEYWRSGTWGICDFSGPNWCPISNNSCDTGWDGGPQVTVDCNGDKLVNSGDFGVRFRNNTWEWRFMGTSNCVDDPACYITPTPTTTPHSRDCREMCSQDSDCVAPLTCQNGKCLSVPPDVSCQQAVGLIVSQDIIRGQTFFTQGFWLYDSITGNQQGWSRSIPVVGGNADWSCSSRDSNYDGLVDCPFGLMTWNDVCYPGSGCEASSGIMQAQDAIDQSTNVWQVFWRGGKMWGRYIPKQPNGDLDWNCGNSGSCPWTGGADFDPVCCGTGCQDSCGGELLAQDSVETPTYLMQAIWVKGGPLDNDVNRGWIRYYEVTNGVPDYNCISGDPLPSDPNINDCEWHGPLSLSSICSSCNIQPGYDIASQDSVEGSTELTQGFWITNPTTLDQMGWVRHVPMVNGYPDWGCVGAGTCPWSLPLYMDTDICKPGSGC